jgi:hypothetical protein
MNKYIAFDLYRKNELGGHEKALQLENQPHGVQVVLVAEVESMEARIAELEKAIVGALSALNKDIKIEPSSFIHEEFTSLMGS